MQKYFAFGVTIESDLDFTGVLSYSLMPTDVLIEERRIEERAKLRTNLYRRGIYAKVSNSEESFILDWPSIAIFKISGGNYIAYQPYSCTDPNTLKLFILSEVFGVVLFQRGKHIMHGSAVNVDNQAIIFLGSAGAGKSTTAAAFRNAGYTVLADDMVVLDFSCEIPKLIPSFGEYKLWRSSIEGLNLSANLPTFKGSDKFLVRQSLNDFPTSYFPISEVNILLKPRSTKKEGLISEGVLPIELLRYFPVAKQLLTKDYLIKQFKECFILMRETRISFKKRPYDFNALNNYVAQYSMKSINKV